MSSFLRDLRLAARSLSRRPAFTLVALLTLALGIGANTAVFSVVNGIVLNPLPYRQPERLIALGNYFISNAELLYMQDNLRQLDRVAAYSPGWGMALTSGGEPAQVTSAKVSPNFLGMLGVALARGRDFASDESTPGRDRVALLEFSFWQSRFGGDSAIVGQTVTLDGSPYTVIGILPHGFHFYTRTPAQFLLPITIDPSSRFHRGQNALAVRATRQFSHAHRRAGGASLARTPDARDVRVARPTTAGTSTSFRSTTTSSGLSSECFLLSWARSDSSCSSPPPMSATSSWCAPRNGVARLRSVSRSAPAAGVLVRLRAGRYRAQGR